jgi:hypothetical protein
LRDPISKTTTKTHHRHKKRAAGVAYGVGPEFKPQNCKKKKKKSTPRQTGNNSNVQQK